MAALFYDRIRETTTTTGTGTITLAGAVADFLPFSTIGDGNQCYYVIDDGTSNWEVGLGTFTLAGTLLARSVLSSSNSNALVNFGAGTKTVRLDVAASFFRAIPNSSLANSSLTVTAGSGLGGGGSVSLGGSISLTANVTTVAGRTGAVVIAASDIGGGNALTRVNDTNVTLTLGGTPATSLLAATSLTLGWSGQLGLARGGTNADLSGTGGTSNYLKQASLGASVTVGTIPASDIASGAALTQANDTNVTLTLGGTPSTALLVAASITAGWTGTLAVSRGGIGVGTLASNGVLYGNGTSAVQALAVNSTGTNKFLTQSSSAAPAWATIVAGDLPGTYANTVTNSDGTLTISPTSGSVVASIALGHANSWTAAQTMLLAGIAGTSTDGLDLSNTTAAANGTQQWSPRLHWIGQGWKTNATAASQTVDFIAELQPVQGAANPSGNLVLSYQVNAGGYTSLTQWNTAGQLISPVGAAATPSLSWVGFTTEGFYRDATGCTTVVVPNGYKSSSWNYNFGTKLAKDQYFGWSKTNGDSTAATSNVVLQANNTTSTLLISSDGSTGVANLQLTGLVTKYNAVATVGGGVPAIYGQGRSTAQIAAVASVATYTVGAADGSFIVSANVLVTASATHSFTVTVAYNDEGNTGRTLTLNFSQVTGTLLTAITNVQGTGAYEGVPLHIRCKASTSITIATTGTFTSVTYNVEGYITQIG